MRSSAVLGLAVLALAAGTTPAVAQNWRSVATSRQNRGEEFLNVKVRYAVGRFEITKGTDPLLYRLESKYDSDAFDLRSRYRPSGRGGRLSIELEGDQAFEFTDIKRYDVAAGSLELALTDAAPVALDLKLGAVEADLDLGGLRLKRIDLKTGASDTRVRFSEPNSEIAEECSFRAGAASFEIEALGNSGCRDITFEGGVGAMTLDFSGAWQHDATADVEVGLGAVEIRVPAEIGVRVERNTFLMGFDAHGLTKRGDAWLSDNWGRADHKLIIHVRGALGTIKVTRI